jgi:type IV pilus assembly protein PilA
MKPETNLKYIFALQERKNSKEGFTLIELLVVMMILGVLAAIAFPNYLTQIGKARESELKNAVGTVIRAQQSYHFEHSSTGFADNLNKLGLGKIAESAEYLDGITVDASGDFATAASENIQYDADETRAYSGAIEFAGGVYSQILCQTDALKQTGDLPVNAQNCPDNNREIN